MGDIVERLKSRRRVMSLNAACDVSETLLAQGKAVTIYMSPPDHTEDTDEDSGDDDDPDYRPIMENLPRRLLQAEAGVVSQALEEEVDITFTPPSTTLNRKKNEQTNKGKKKIQNSNE